MKTNWNYPTTIWVGENRIQDLGIACKNLKIDKPQGPAPIIATLVMIIFPLQLKL